jgi:hypothetical protein
MRSHAWLTALPRGGAGALLRSVLLPLLLLLAQQGPLLHEMGHLAAAEWPDGNTRQDAAGLCKLCLAISQVQAAASPAVLPLGLLSGLSFGWLCAAADSVCGATPPALHNRGPPVSI